LQCWISPDIPVGLFDIVQLHRHPGLVPGSAAQQRPHCVVEMQTPAQGRGDDEGGVCAAPMASANIGNIRTLIEREAAAFLD
jgi:hypothetical protein